MIMVNFEALIFMLKIWQQLGAVLRALHAPIQLHYQIQKSLKYL